MTDKISMVSIPSGLQVLAKGGELYIGFNIVGDDGLASGTPSIGKFSHKMLCDLQQMIAKVNQHQFSGNFEMQIVNGKVDSPYLGKEDRAEERVDFSERGNKQ
jgi:hypothetical protein